MKDEKLVRGVYRCLEQLAAGFGLHTTRVSTHSELVDALNTVPTAGPRLLNVLVEPAADALY
jgi:thiamine pyrophosphate-dependent acetolactate synthase large subunit-like protein